MHKLIPYLCLLFFFSANGKVHNTQHPLTSEIQNIRVQAKRANIHLTPQTDNKVSIQSEKPIEVTEDKKKGTLLISEKDFSQEKSQALSLSTKQNKITLKAPIQKPITLVLFQGTVRAKSVPKAGSFKNLSIMIARRGLVHTRNTKGTLFVSQSTGDVQIHSHKGKLTIQGERVKARLQACQGEMSFVGFKSQMKVENSRGSLVTRSFKLPLTVSKFQGQVDFRQEKGAVYLKNITGSISGYSKEGEVRGLIYPKKVSIETKIGKIHLNIPQSQAWVQADTREGRLWTPTYFNRIRTGGIDRAQGRLRGKKRKDGHVSLKSQSGSIKVYQSTQ